MNQNKDLNQLNHFEKFSLNPSFKIDINDLEKKYLQFQKQFHPDSSINKDIKEQTLAISNSIAINEAHEILKNPLKRAIYLLKLSGIDINDDHCHIKPNQETLILVMEIKEQIFASNNKNEIDEIRDSVQDKIKQLMQQVELDFENKEYQKLAEKLIEIKYLDKTLIDLKLKKQKIK